MVGDYIGYPQYSSTLRVYVASPVFCENAVTNELKTCVVLAIAYDSVLLRQSIMANYALPHFSYRQDGTCPRHRSWSGLSNGSTKKKKIQSKRSLRALWFGLVWIGWFGLVFCSAPSSLFVPPCVLFMC
jgi:hypothetical protein